MTDRYEAPMTPENPKKMWIFTWVSDDTEVGPGVGWEASPLPHTMRERARGFCYEDVSEPAEYLRADVYDALAAKLERAEAQLEAVSREGWRACVLLAAAKGQIDAEITYAETLRAAAYEADESAIVELYKQAGALEDEADQLRKWAKEAKPWAPGLPLRR